MKQLRSGRFYPSAGLYHCNEVLDLRHVDVQAAIRRPSEVPPQLPRRGSAAKTAPPSLWWPRQGDGHGAPIAGGARQVLADAYAWLPAARPTALCSNGSRRQSQLKVRPQFVQKFLGLTFQESVHA